MHASNSFPPMDSLHSSLLLMIITQISVSFFLLHSPSSSYAAPARLVDRVCKTTTISSYTDCVAALELDPRTPSASKPKALAKIALALAVTNSTKGKEYIDAMAKSGSSSPPLKSALEYCVSSYESVVSSFKSSLQEVDEDAMTANYDAKVAADGANKCEQWLSSKGFHVPSVTTRNKYVRIYSDIGFVVTDML